MPIKDMDDTNLQKFISHITSIKENRVTGVIVINSDNINHSKENRSGRRRHRPKSWPKAPEDMNRMYNTAIDCLDKADCKK